MIKPGTLLASDMKGMSARGGPADRQLDLRCIHSAINGTGRGKPAGRRGELSPMRQMFTVAEVCLMPPGWHLMSGADAAVLFESRVGEGHEGGPLRFHLLGDHFDLALREGRERRIWPAGTQ